MLSLFLTDFDRWTDGWMDGWMDGELAVCVVGRNKLGGGGGERPEKKGTYIHTYSYVLAIILF